ncbi:hypothetical protein MUU47_17305 [Scandinavium sp. H11S7]|uniref:Lipoprotein n=1 Tax=Scandinavium hiltneri TaxID=2926519 RepID=A0ABT2E4M8_9ENTR|nr:hypothetical protein [Scandinavium hiltneri]MCS2162845.1 hypothetical protein [Scandinavium hiltneri]
MKKLLYVLPVFLLAGCGDKAPKCSGEDSIGVVKKILTREYLQKGLIKLTEVNVQAIRTIGVDKEVDISHCAASVSMKDDADREYQKDITYDTQYTDDKSQIYVTIN